MAINRKHVYFSREVKSFDVVHTLASLLVIFVFSDVKTAESGYLCMPRHFLNT